MSCQRSKSISRVASLAALMVGASKALGVLRSSDDDLTSGEESNGNMLLDGRTPCRIELIQCPRISGRGVGFGGVNQGTYNQFGWASRAKCIDERLFVETFGVKAGMNPRQRRHGIPHPPRGSIPQSLFQYPTFLKRWKLLITILVSSGRRKADLFSRSLNCKGLSSGRVAHNPDFLTDGFAGSLNEINQDHRTILEDGLIVLHAVDRGVASRSRYVTTVYCQ